VRTYDAPVNSQQPLWPYYLLGGVGIVLMVLGAVETALAIWQRVFLFSVVFMVLSAFGWVLYKYAELSATSSESEQRPDRPTERT
jgi:hypothetical protein